MASTDVPTETEVLPLEEIRRRYASEWVLLDRLQTADGPAVLAGRVLWHSPDRSELYRKAMELRPTQGAVLFLGEPPGEVAVNL